MVKNQDKSLGYAALSVLIWSTVATAFKLALRELDPVQLIFIASGVSALFLLFWLLVTGQFRQLSQTTGRELLRSMAVGLLNPFGYYLILFKAYSLLPAQLAQPLNMIWPVTLAFLSIPLLKQKITWRQFLALGVCLLGIVLLSSQGSISGFRNTSLTGVILALGSSLLWALFWIFNIKDQRPEAVKLFLNFFFGFLYLLMIMTLFSEFRFPAGISLWAALYTGLFEVGITYLLWMKAMQLSDNNAVTGSLIYAAPFLSLLLISSVLGEKIHPTTIAGLVLIVSGIVYQQIKRR
ncbi:MAG TPA: DMT family transporter [Prolixibacteraceae bacterium]|jgi:drug/metabolite transporter (DMT)-like permease|nr:DMT family transporter [Bacteroidales bacterium]HOY92579.1 DMT family transporter [Prolixibacteraceae bacterium]